jgi:drug/metabolite transporter (DMT)-like permease
MTPQPLRIVYAIEFLVALVAIFTAWSEIGGQATLDLMHWGWKAGLSLLLAAAIVGFSAAIAAQERLWSIRSGRWFVLVLICVSAIAAVTYYYGLQLDTSEPEESGALSRVHPIRPIWQLS